MIGTNKPFRLFSTRRIWLTKVYIMFIDDIVLISTWSWVYFRAVWIVVHCVFCHLGVCFLVLAVTLSHVAVGLSTLERHRLWQLRNKLDKGMNLCSHNCFWIFLPRPSSRAECFITTFAQKLAWGSGLTGKNTFSTLKSSSHPRLNEFVNTVVLFKSLWFYCCCSCL